MSGETMPSDHTPSSEFALPETPFKDLLWNRGSYTPAETGSFDPNALFDFLSPCKSQLADLDGVLHKLEARVVQVKRARDDLNDFITKHQQLLISRPVYKLSPEVLGLIFLQCVEAERADDEDEYSFESRSDISYETDSGTSSRGSYENDIGEYEDDEYGHFIPPSRSTGDDTDTLSMSSDATGTSGRYYPYYHEPLITRRAPWVLTQVSHSWRTIAFALPELWASISIDYGVQAVLCRNTSPDLLQKQLSLAGAFPLRIQFYCEAKAHKDIALDYIHAITHYSNQWLELDFCSSAENLRALHNCGIAGDWTFCVNLTFSSTVSAVHTLPMQTLELHPAYIGSLAPTPMGSPLLSHRFLPAC